MDNKKTAMFGVVIAVAAGLFGVNIAQINDNSQEVMTNDLVAKSPIYGHITVIEKNLKGNIVAYRQSDNTIVNQGLNCMGVALFRVAASTDRDACGGAGSGGTVAAFNTANGFNWIQIGTANVAPDQTQNALQGATTGTSYEGSTIPALTPAGTGTSGTGGVGTGPTVVIAVTGLHPTGSQTIQEAGLFDSAETASTANMFARQTFAAITMGSGDTLAVTWTITLAHS